MTPQNWIAFRRLPGNGLGERAPKNPISRQISVVEGARQSREGAGILERASSTRLYALILLDLATGARRGELLALQWPDIDFSTGVMNVTKSLEQTKQGLRVKTTKSGESRRCSVPAAALDALRDHQALQEKDRELFGADYQENDLVFCRPDGGYYSPDRAGARVVEVMRKAASTGKPSLAASYTRQRTAEQWRADSDSSEASRPCERQRYALDLHPRRRGR